VRTFKCAKGVNRYGVNKMRNVWKLLTSPAEAIANAKKKISAFNTIGILVLDAIVFAAAAGIAIWQLGNLLPLGTLLGGTETFVAIVTVVVFVLVILLSLFGGWLVKTAVTTLGGKGKYLDGLTTVAYSGLSPAIGFLITAIVFKLGIAGTIITAIVLPSAIVLGLATFYRSVKEFFSADLLVALIATSILTIATVAMFYAVAFTMMGGGLLGLGAAGLPLAG